MKLSREELIFLNRETDSRRNSLRQHGIWSIFRQNTFKPWS
ncbi:MAG: hypothetical protein NT02SARS_1723 [SAR86 cluster bacterium SAR86B]|uniref:Uncharacterized protein n=1 Tax=SAR86 cluster bacterium SAR86B TaxID=1123867 RepID=J4X6E9_9GAMM|nr:MAG: hypothetical protein NT02SARS_1723 [SAR86 cluster bacterium SAR86B]